MLTMSVVPMVFHRIGRRSPNEVNGKLLNSVLFYFKYNCLVKIPASFYMQNFVLNLKVDDYLIGYIKKNLNS